MDKVSRRKAIGAVAASAVAGAVVPALTAEAQDQPAQNADQGAPKTAVSRRLHEGALPPLRKVTLREFQAVQLSGDVQRVLGTLNGGTFMDCHCLVRESTGIWIQDLVPVFQKLDAIMVTRQLPAELLR